MPRTNIPLLLLLVVVAPALLPSKLEENGNAVSDNQQRIMRQFGFDQGSVMIVGESVIFKYPRFGVKVHSQ